MAFVGRSENKVRNTLSEKPSPPTLADTGVVVWSLNLTLKSFAWILAGSRATLNLSSIEFLRFVRLVVRSPKVSRYRPVYAAIIANWGGAGVTVGPMRGVGTTGTLVTGVGVSVGVGVGVGVDGMGGGLTSTLVATAFTVGVGMGVGAGVGGLGGGLTSTLVAGSDGSNAVS